MGLQQLVTQLTGIFGSTDAAQPAETQPAAEQQKVFLYSPGYVDFYSNHCFYTAPIGHEYGATRLLVLKGSDGQLIKHEYTVCGDITPETTDEDALKIHGNNKAWLVWRGPESEIVFHGPHKGYERQLEIARLAAEDAAAPAAPSVDS